MGTINDDNDSSKEPNEQSPVTLADPVIPETDLPQQTIPDGTAISAPGKEYTDLIHSLNLENEKSPSIMLAGTVNLDLLSQQAVEDLLKELKRETENPDLMISRFAKVQLGRLYIARFGDIALGLVLWTQAAEEGEPIAQNYLGGWYFNEENAEYDLDKAIYWTKKAADQGWPKSQHFLGCLYDQGIGVEKDPGKSLEWWEKAAEQGYLESQFILGQSYLERVGEDPNNKDKALKWLEKASGQGSVHAQYNLATYYSDSNEMDKAFHYYSLAAQSGYGDSLLHVAIMYRDGIGVEKSLDRALEYFTEASQNNDPKISREAKFNIGCLYNDKLNSKAKALPWWEKAAIEGDVGSQYNLALAYAYGDDGVATDFRKAEMWLEKIWGQENLPFSQEDMESIRDQIIILQLSKGMYTGQGKLYQRNGKLKLDSNGVDDKPVMGKALETEYYDNGRLKYEGEMVSGKRSGQGKSFWEDGTLAYDGNWVDGKWSGQGKMFWENGLLMYEGNWLDGEMSGYGKRYHQNGNLNLDGNWVNGKMSGYGQRYEENGMLAYDGNWVNGNLTGIGKMYDEFGLTYDGNWLNGLMSGQGKSYWENGNLQYDGNWVEGIRSGKGTFYRNNGTLSYEGMWSGDKRSGPGKMYDENGKLTCEGLFIDDKYAGPGNLHHEHEDLKVAATGADDRPVIGKSLEKEYYNNGSLMYEGEMVDGKRSGKGQSYDKNGKLLYDGYWLNNNKSGLGRSYDAESGKLLYDGNWVDDTRSGQGKCYRKDGTLLYEGNWASDKVSGQGRYYGKNGALFYDGNSIDNHPSGQGKMYGDNGEIVYEGTFLNGKPAPSVGETEDGSKKYRRRTSKDLAMREPCPRCGSERTVKDAAWTMIRLFGVCMSSIFVLVFVQKSPFLTTLVLLITLWAIFNVGKQVKRRKKCVECAYTWRYPAEQPPH